MPWRALSRATLVPDDIAEQLALAGELAASVVLHASPTGRRGPLRLGGVWEGSSMTLRVLHKGRAADRSVLPEKDCCIAPGQRGGMGLVIAQRAADRLCLVCTKGWRGFRLERAFTPRTDPPA